MASPMSSMAAMTWRDFDHIRHMAREACGIDLRPNKRALVSSRLERLVRRNGFQSFSGYLTFLSRRRHGDEFAEFIDALTTNHTGFWREPEHFEFLRREIIPLHKSRLRIWSAACATGEEPYTIGMCALDAGVANCRIAATDISHAALETADRGVYSTIRLAELPKGWRNRYFVPAAQRHLRGVIPALRAMVDFRRLNLLAAPGFTGTFDAIFCRNVMIYFDQSTRDDLVARLALQLSPGGHLFTGHSETPLRLPGNLCYVQPAAYRKIE